VTKFTHFEKNGAVHFVFLGAFLQKIRWLGLCCLAGMSKVSTDQSTSIEVQMAEPTKYIVRCCEMRKRRSEMKSAPVGSRPRVRVSVEN
jgi:hypothetical protein